MIRDAGRCAGLRSVLLIRAAGLVILEVPKTGTQALRAALGDRAEIGYGGAPRHIGAGGFLGRHADAVAAEIGRRAETVAVVRAPLDSLASWHRFLQRDKVAGGPRSSTGTSFEAFVLASLQPDPPAYARIGRQDRFVGWNGTAAAVDHLFDYRRLDLLMAFLSARVPGVAALPRRNRSPRVPTGTLAPDTEALLRQRRAAEFAMYDAVAAVGHLRRG